MHRHKFIANYTIACGREWINHITTVDGEGRLVSVVPFNGELAATRYVSGVLLLLPAGGAPRGMELASLAADRNALCAALAAESARVGEAVAVIERDFADGATRRLL